MTPNVIVEEVLSSSSSPTRRPLPRISSHSHGWRPDLNNCNRVGRCQILRPSILTGRKGDRLETPASVVLASKRSLLLPLLLEQAKSPECAGFRWFWNISAPAVGETVAVVWGALPLQFAHVHGRTGSA
uniref:Uncharacterized protein n=1 Tax=Leersia perrieri TaxID=77586 RepID=A0A0D9VZ97_9ORYZ